MLEEEDGCVMKEASGNDQQQKSEGGGTNQSNSILERLKTIRLGKSKILAALSMLREREKSDKVVDRQLMVKLLSSYDSLVAQEDEYIILIKRLADAERKFIQNEVEEGSKALDDSVLQFGDGTLALDIWKAKVLAGVVQRDESPAVSNSAAKASGGDDETEDDATAAARYAREAESAARNAAVASQINDSLQRNIQLTQQKIEQLKRVYAEKLRQQSNGASKASLDLDAVKQKLGKERNSVERKQQLVDRLRRKAETKRVEAALLCSGAPDDLFSATRTRSGEAESGVDAGDSLSIERVLLLSADDSDNCSGGEQYAHRVPPLPANVGGDATSASTGLLDNNSGDAKEADSDKLSENKSTLHARISARFAAFEARKQRMRELRAQLNRVERRQMDQTYGDALHRLKNLTKMRQQLESMSATYTGGGIEDTSGNGEGEDCDDRNIDEAFAAAQARLSLKRLPDGGVDTVTVTSSAAAGLPNQISEDGASSSLKHLSASLATDELIAEVRQSFNATLLKHAQHLLRGAAPAALENSTATVDTSTTERDACAVTLSASYVDDPASAATDREARRCPSNAHVAVLHGSSQHHHHHHCRHHSSSYQPFFFENANNNDETRCSYCWCPGLANTNNNTLDVMGTRLRRMEEVLHSHTDQLSWIGDQISCLSDAFEQLRHDKRLEDEKHKQQQQQHNPLHSYCHQHHHHCCGSPTISTSVSTQPFYHYSRHSNNSAVTVVAMPTSTAQPTITASSLLPSPPMTTTVAQSSLLQLPPTFLHQQKHNNMLLLAPIKRCLLNGNRAALNELLSVCAELSIGAEGQMGGNYEEQVDTLLRRVLTGAAVGGVYSSPPPSAFLFAPTSPGTGSAFMVPQSPGAAAAGLTFRVPELGNPPPSGGVPASTSPTPPPISDAQQQPSGMQDDSATGNAGSHFIVNNASQQNHECRDVSSSSDQAKHLEELRDQLNTESARLEKERTMECVRRTFVIGGPPIKTGERESEEGNEAAADGGSAHLERHICATVELVIKWLDDNPDIFWTPACDQHLPDTLKRQNRAHELRDLVIAEASHALLEQDAAERMEFSEQLAPYLDDILAQFFSASHDESIIAQTSHDRQRELLVFQLSEILYNELTFWRLIHSADRLIE